MSYYILNDKGISLRRTTIRALTPEEQESESKAAVKKAFDTNILKKLGGGMLGEWQQLQEIPPPPRKQKAQQVAVAKTNPDLAPFAQYTTPEYESYEDDYQKVMPLSEEFDVDTYDVYPTAQVRLPLEDHYTIGNVKRRKRDKDGNLLGTANTNPILDTRVYEVEFPDGQVLEYAANVIAENLYAQVDQEGRHQLILDGIVGHRKDSSAVALDDQIIVVNGKNCKRKSTVGWDLCIQWKDGSTSWEKLSGLKEAYPVETAEYAVVHKIVSEPAFNWWVPDTVTASLFQWTVNIPRQPTSLGLNFPRPFNRPWILINVLTLSIGTMPSRRRCAMQRLHSTYCVKTKTYVWGTNLLNVIWSLTLKWGHCNGRRA